ncbi:AraC family transcriptional regulator [Azospirillum sp. SYSU D00513]|uniref:helix-turn-helix domain-containing protein n=1 Tax=Azospirillum sp. SYSU D00513 TaxID=2812561 RepID=UPI001A95EFB9|nr:AraC family transcriptional regulator [Azospirillum sp. SYSU D00513]
MAATSLGRGWNGVAAELRSHPAGDLPAILPTQMEVTLATRRSPGAFVRRKGAGLRQRSAVEQGAIWLCPVGVGEDEIGISAPLDEILHIYLPADRFDALADLYGDGRIRADAIRYLADLRDPLIWQIGLSIRSELLRETSAGRMMVESAALALAARLAHAYGEDCPNNPDAAPEADCPKRIARAIDFIRDNLERDISVSELAEVACLSPFHFARMFKRVMGKTPHGFVSAERFELARRLLGDPDMPLVTVAHRSGFSNQAAFSTAFKRAMGCTPGDYRRRIP